MGTRPGARGVFAIPWEQTEIDGLGGAPPEELSPGASWRWEGAPVRLDGPAGILPLGEPLGAEAARARAARAAGRLHGTAPAAASAPDLAEPLADGAFSVTDGRQEWILALVPSAAGLVAVAAGDLPPPGAELWVVRRAPRLVPAPAASGPAVICFTQGTRIDTPGGPRPVEQLEPGDRVLTCDDGPQEVLWIGRRTVSAARLRARPALRPVRIRAGALGSRRPGDDLLVSPDHRVLIRSRGAADLFGTPEVLVAARDLLGDFAVSVDHSLRPVTYVHLLFARHQILRANGVESESLHPAAAAPDALDAAGLCVLDALAPGGAADPARYGPPARRVLTTAEAALLAADRAPLQ